MREDGVGLADKNNALAVQAPPPAPKLKIRLSGLGSKGKERERESVTPATPAATPSGNENGIGFVNGSGHVNGYRRSTPLPGQSVEVNDSEEEREGDRRKLSIAREIREQEERKASEWEQLQLDLLELPSIARQHLVPITEIARRVIRRSFKELQSLVEV